jgi:hypothetical protein
MMNCEKQLTDACAQQAGATRIARMGAVPKAKVEDENEDGGGQNPSGNVAFRRVSAHNNA